MDGSAVSALLELARSDAPLVLESGREWLMRLNESDHLDKSVVLRAMSIAARFAATMDESVRYGQRSVLEAELTGDRTTRSEAMTTLAGSLAISGDTDRALDVLDSAAQIAPKAVLAAIQMQRGAILGTRGDVAPALAALSAALPVLDEVGDAVRTAMTHHNRGLLLVLTGDLDAAEADLKVAGRLHTEHGHWYELSGVEHNLGLLAAHRGDIPEALRHFAESEALEKQQTGSTTPLHASQCEVLLSAGLFREALSLATRIYERHVSQGLGEDEAEARLVAAQAALLGGYLAKASDLAESAAKLFEKQGRATWVTNARRVEIRARYEAGALDQELLEAARKVADDLEGGMSIPAYDARLTAGLIALDMGQADAATEDLEKVAQLDSGPVELRLQARLARARLCLARGDRMGADAAARAGIRLLAEYQAALGASDIRAGIENHAAALGSLGLLLALESGRARRLFTWMERTRAGSLRFRPVITPDDSSQAEDLTSLRIVAAELRSADLEGARRLARKLRELQESVRDRARMTRGTGGATDRVDPAGLAGALGDRTLVEMAEVDGILWAVVVRRGRFRLREVGPHAVILRELQSLRFTMRRLARGRGSIATAGEVARRLDHLLFGSLRLAEGPLVIAPTPGLHAVPWWALPTCQDRPVTISPSAELWFRATQAKLKGRRTLLVAGSDLHMADAEVVEVSGVYPKATVLSSPESEVETVQAHLDGARLAHIASHAYFQFENPMFSSLHLADGDLNVYDIERLNTAPGMVVLSACDSGFSETHPGEELMGLSSALLSMGTKSIIASVGLVPDSAATKDLMVALHRGLVAGLRPSHALHRAQTEVAETAEGYIAASSFVCIGAD